MNASQMRAMARRAAERGEFPEIAQLSEDEIRLLIHEFGVYQSELLAQNEELRALRSDVERARDKYVELYDVAPVGYLTLDRKGTIQEANLTSTTMLRVPRGELLGNPLARHLIAHAADRLHLHLAQVLKQGTATCELELSQGNGIAGRVLRLDTRVSPRNPELLYTTLVDITERQHLELELRAAKERAEAASRSKSEFLANMSHEIRTPMNGVLGMLQLLDSKELSAKQQDYVAIARESAQALLTIIDDILDLSRIEAGKMRVNVGPFHVRALMDGLRGLFVRQARDKGLDLTIRVSEAVPERLTGDEARIRQILVNLLGNALKFTAKGSVMVTVSAAGSGGIQWVTFSVRDTGIGIPEDKQHLLFNAFSQVESDYTRKIAGTGLGLAIVKRLVTLMRGRVSLTSTPGEGTRVWFVLPLEAPAEPPEQVPEAEVPAPPHRDLRILLAEDNLVNQLAAQEFLKDFGHQVTVTSTGRQALEALDRETFDAVLMDVQMPEMDGFEATAAIRAGRTKADPHIPIIALTAYAMDSDHDRCLEAGMDDHIAKPFDFVELDRKIQRLVAADPSSGEAPVSTPS